MAKRKEINISSRVSRGDTINRIIEAREKVESNGSNQTDMQAKTAVILSDDGVRQYESANRSLKAKEAQLRDSIIEFAYALHDMNTRRLYEHAGYTNFRAYIAGELSISKSMTYKYIGIVDAIEHGNISRNDVESLGIEKTEAYIRYADNPKAKRLKTAMLKGTLSYADFIAQVKKDDTASVKK